jgi:hypothetical protein
VVQHVWSKIIHILFSFLYEYIFKKRNILLHGFCILKEKPSLHGWPHAETRDFAGRSSLYFFASVFLEHLFISGPLTSSSPSPYASSPLPPPPCCSLYLYIQRERERERERERALSSGRREGNRDGEHLPRRREGSRSGGFQAI